MVDFELGLYHACCPQSYSQNICLRGHVIWRSDAGHVLKETTEWGRGGGERKRGTKRRKAEEKRRAKREEENFNKLKTNFRSKENKISYQLRVCQLVHCVCVCVCVYHGHASCQAVGRVCSDKLEPQGAQRLIMMNIHTVVYHNNTLRLSFQTQINIASIINCITCVRALSEMWSFPNTHTLCRL